jgi:hypothetical protein
MASMGKSKLKRTILWSSTFVIGLALSLGAIRSAGRRGATHTLDLVRKESKLSSLPPVILWAWERPEKLDFIDQNKVGVAFLAKTLYLRGEQVVARPRLQSLIIQNGTAVIAVARIESDRSERPTLSRMQIEAAATEISTLVHLPQVVAVQIDFDATTSERIFYSALLSRVRNILPPSVGLSITALASWCKGDKWLGNLPVDEAVPMLFRMGTDRAQIISSLAAGEEFRASPCQQSEGVSTDEPLPHLPARQRVYVFNPKPWSPNAVKTVLEKYRQ